MKPRTIDEYLATLSAGKRAALQKLRRAIKSAAPEAEECISYQIPAFRFRGRILVWFGAATNHCSFYPGAHPIKVLEDELEGYETSKGTIRFPFSGPVPVKLIERIAKFQAKEVAGRGKAPPKKR